MSDNKLFNKRRGKKNNRSNRSKKNNRFIPTQEQRVDKELLQEVSVLLSVNPNIENKTLKKLYHITDRQLDYIKEHKQNWDIVDKITGKEVK